MEAIADSRYPHELPPLPYDKKALEPLISAETLEYHYGKHHRAYVNKLNELIKGTEFEPMTLADVVAKSSGGVFNNAAQTWNHTFYWHCLSPQQDRPVPPELRKALDASFGSFDKFASEFKSCAATLFGTGWAWLTRKADGTLAIAQGDDADTPVRWKETPLLTCDVWEHAYYIDYRNERPKYIDAFWRLVNWDFVAQNLARR